MQDHHVALTVLYSHTFILGFCISLLHSGKVSCPCAPDMLPRSHLLCCPPSHNLLLCRLLHHCKSYIFSLDSRPIVSLDQELSGPDSLQIHSSVVIFKGSPYTFLQGFSSPSPFSGPPYFQIAFQEGFHLYVTLQTSSSKWQSRSAPSGSSDISLQVSPQIFSFYSFSK